jgi:hypothetical protein
MGVTKSRATGDAGGINPMQCFGRALENQGLDWKTAMQG